MAAPLVRGVGAYGSGTTSFTAAVPTGGSAPQSGDVMLIVMESSDSTTAAGTPNTPADWTKIFENTIAPGAANVSTLTIFAKLAGAGEGNVTVDGVGDHCSGAMLVVATPHGVTNVATDIVVGATTDHGTNTVNLLAASIGVTADSLIAILMGLSDNANDTTNVSGVTNANLASIVEQIDNTTTTGDGGGVGIYTATCAGTTTGTTEWDHDTAVQSQSLQLGIPPYVAQTYDVARAEAVTAAASQTAVATFAGARAETLAAAATQTVLGTFVGNPEESLAVADTPTATAIMGAGRDESVTAADSATGGLLVAGGQDDAMAPADAPSATAIFAVARAEALAAADSCDATVIPGGGGSARVMLIL